MNKYNCNCNQAAGYQPCMKPAQITLRTTVLPANLGPDTEGAPYAPRLGAHYNAVVKYQANGAVYIYDSNGIYTLVEPANYDELVQKVDGLAEALTALQTKEQEDVDNLQTNINAEVNARTEADAAINQRITDIQNSPDVRFIEPTYAALQELDKSGIGDKDYARVLQDENHNGASTYYQFNLADQAWEYVGEVGSYYTKEEIDNMIGDVESLLTKLDTGEGAE